MAYSVKYLQNFEKEVIKQWEKGKTLGPIHLSGSVGEVQEESLINIFKNVKQGDWVFSTHRSHYHALLKSKNPKWLMREIIQKANSSHINSREYKIFTSSIVGGNISPALGVALALKMKNSKDRVWCFVGDMASEMGQFMEAYKYANGFDLPIIFVIENNNIGCETPTKQVWGQKNKYFPSKNLLWYSYKRIYPHCGTGKWLKFKNFKSTGNYDAFK